MGMVAEALLEARLQPLALQAHIVEQPVAADHLLHRERGGAGIGWPI